jgi:DNA-directed RNA polymerase subunit F
VHLLEEFEKINTGGNSVLSRVLEIAPQTSVDIKTVLNVHSHGSQEII